jgi:hypothetical protein
MKQKGKPPAPEGKKLVQIENGTLDVKAAQMLPLEDRKRIAKDLWWWRRVRTPDCARDDPSIYPEYMEYYAFLHELEVRAKYRSDGKEYRWEGGKQWFELNEGEAYELVAKMRSKYIAPSDRRVLRTNGPPGTRLGFPDRTDLTYMPVWINLTARDKNIIAQLRVMLKEVRAFRKLKQLPRRVEFQYPWDGIEAIDHENLLSVPRDGTLKKQTLSSTQRKAAQRAWAVLDREHEYLQNSTDEIKRMVESARKENAQDSEFLAVALEAIAIQRRKSDS